MSRSPHFRGFPSQRRGYGTPRPANFRGRPPPNYGPRGGPVSPYFYHPQEGYRHEGGPGHPVLSPTGAPARAPAPTNWTGIQGPPKSYHPGGPPPHYTCHGPQHGQPFHPRGTGRGSYGRGRGSKRMNEESQPQHNFKKAKKQKVDKRELAEFNVYFCETCDRGFKDEDKYKIHVDGHETCNVEGCSYTAAPKLLRLHFQWQHRTGLAKKIWQLESKEDIQKWKNERKRNFPTAANIARKKATNEEKKERGEVLETKYFGKMRGRGRGRGQNRSSNNRGQQRGNRDRNDGENQGNRVSDEIERGENKNDEDKQKSLPLVSSTDTNQLQVDPLALLLSKQNSDTEEPEVLKTDKPQSVNSSSPVGLPGALGSLVSSYGDDSESDGEEIQTHSTKFASVDSKSITYNKLITTAETQETLSEAHPEQNLHDSPTERNRTNENKDANNQQETWRGKPHNVKNQHKRRQRGKKGGAKQPMVPKKRLTLLEKLLAGDIRHERNVLLQCIRHCVKTRFLGVGQKNISTVKTQSEVVDGPNDKEENNENASVPKTVSHLIDEEIWEEGV